MTKILFSNPPWFTGGDDGQLRIGIRAGSRWPFTRHTVHAPDAFRFGGYLPVPFFMVSAAAYAAQRIEGAEVQIRDSIARGESYEAFFNHVRAFAPDWLVIETATPCREHDLRLIEAVKAGLPSTKIILTGTVVSDCKFTLPDSCYAAVKGEYEKGVVKVIRGIASGIVPHELLTVEELNEMPFPMCDEACAMHYHDGCPNGQQFPQLQVWTSRGCPYRCCFCVWPAAMTGNDPDGTGSRKVRSYSAAWVEGMLMDRITKAEQAGTPYKCIYLDDDTFNLTQRHTVAICGVMARIGLPWSAMCRADTIDRETWQMMKDAGCFGVKIGFESGVQRVVDQIVNKRLDITAAAETARFLRSIGMTVHGTFTVGMPGETKDEQATTLRFIEELHRTGAIDSHQLSGTAVIEGTPLATLLDGGADLPKYPGMHASDAAGYEVQRDGQAKAERMRADRATDATALTP